MIIVVRHKLISKFQEQKLYANTSDISPFFTRFDKTVLSTPEEIAAFVQTGTVEMINVPKYRTLTRPRYNTLSVTPESQAQGKSPC